MTQELHIRQATLDDAAIIGFQDMGLVSNELCQSFRTKALDRLGKALASGDYSGPPVSQRTAPQRIIADAGVII